MTYDLHDILGENGAFAKIFDRFEYRPQQFAMAEAVAKALTEKRHCLVEAGTGVGKTVAYLVPAVLHARSGKRIIVSTHTINLQAQLLSKDIPLVQSVMEEMPFRAV